MANPAVQTSVVVLPKAEQGAPPVQPAPLVRPVVESEPLVDQELVRKNLHAAIEKLNEQVESNGRGLNFSMDELLNRPVITVRNTSTGEVVRQIPNEVVIKVAHSIENIKGLLMDQML
jgi:flagellar protein FlaG